MCVMFAILPQYREARILDILEHVHNTPLLFRTWLLHWMAEAPYITSQMTHIVTDPARAGAHLVSGMTYTKFAGTMSTFLIKCVVYVPHWSGVKTLMVYIYPAGLGAGHCCATLRSALSYMCCHRPTERSFSNRH